MPQSRFASRVRAAELIIAMAVAGSAPTVAGAQAKAAGPAAGYSFRVVYQFQGSPDAAYPWSGLVLAKDGNLYGTTWAGGAYPNCRGGLGAGCGALYRLDPAGSETVIYSFPGVTGPIHLYGSLLPAGDGSFYGLTNEGGTPQFCYQGGAHGCGTVFKLNENGKLRVLYNFGAQGQYSDGLFPEGELIRDSRGNFFGTTSIGGTNNNGTIFEVTSRGAETVVYRFTGGADGARPSASLVRDSAGNLYGTTSSGGGTCNCGTVFMLSPSGVLTTLYTFQGGADGGDPIAGVIRDEAGNLYGTTAGDGDKTCGNGYGCGVIFKLDSTGTETVLHTFSGPPDGSLPNSQLVRDGKGDLYGTTWAGGDNSCASGIGCGVVFKMTASGKESVLHAFSGNDGMFPWGRLYVGKTGAIFGTTQVGGTFGACPNGCGVVYLLAAPGS